ncbi:MAG: hypothetical protein CSYNP_02289 [Syntrophus sp. SKADARSKE-3]|nr:hypothetical protein [Syntrophus sp. SKADARSKE-3]
MTASFFMNNASACHRGQLPAMIKLNYETGRSKKGESQMQNRYAIWCLLVITLWVSGCAVIGRGKDYRAFDEKTLAQVTPGRTTAAEVTGMFGPPSQMVKLINGNAYIYDRSLSKATGIWLVLVTFVNYDTQHDRIVFFLSKDNIVTHVGSSFQTDAASYGTPF